MTVVLDIIKVPFNNDYTALGDSYYGLPPWFYKSVSPKKKLNMVKTLQKCKRRNISVLKKNYINIAGKANKFRKYSTLKTMLSKKSK